jgi:L-histidine N-alpha-methyltransferase
MTMRSGTPTAIEVRLTSEALREQLRRDVSAGLSAEHKSIPSAWFYDELGSHLFDEITRLEEYYQTRTERSLLARHAAEIVALSGARSLVELGSGTCEKTRVLLDQMERNSQLDSIVPIDISVEMLERSVEELGREYPSANVRGLASDFDSALEALPDVPGRLVAFLGGTIGNFSSSGRSVLFKNLSDQLRDGEWFLLGCDLVKDPARLVAAYDDAQGVTAAFNKNILSVINRELRADFDLDAFAHVAIWNPEEKWIEMRLRSLVDQTVTVRDLELKVDLSDGEEILTEISAKFSLDGIEAELFGSGFEVMEQWTDPQHDFALALARQTREK